MSQQFPGLVVVAPLLAGLLISAAGWVNKRLCFPIAVAALAVATFSSIGLLLRVLDEGVIVYKLGGWDPPMGIAYYVDHLNGLVLVVVAIVALVNLIASKKSIEEEFPEKTGPFYSLYVLMVTGLLGIVVTGDAFNLYVLLEIAALTGYGLLGMGSEDRAPLATLHYLYMGTIGACFYLLGVGYLYIVTGSLNMVDIANILPSLYQSKAAQDGLLSSACLVAQRVHIRPFCSQQLDCSFGHQSDDLCDDPPHAHSVYTKIYLYHLGTKRGCCLACRHCYFHGGPAGT
jgi:multicomponent Na+:H+ antiporter subunit D